MSKHVREANSRIFLDERDLWPNGDFMTAHIIVRTDYLEQNPDVIERLIEAHIDETDWINSHPEEAREVFNAELTRLTGKAIPDDQYRDAISRLRLTCDPVQESLIGSAESAYEIGFFDKEPNLDGIYDLKILNNVLRERELAEIA